MQYVSELSSGRVELGAGTLYGALKSLVKKSWIKQVSETERRKANLITEAGKEAMTAE